MARTASSVAYVDESVASGFFYTVTGVVVPRSEVALVRAALTTLVPLGVRVHHTVDLSDVEREALAAFIASSDRLRSMVVVRAPIDGGDEEGARGRAMTELLPRLTHAGVATIVVDSRRSPMARNPEKPNLRDRETMSKLVSAGAVPASTRLQFVRDTDEPMLGLPDYVGWSVRRDLLEGGESRVAALGERVRLVEARLRLVQPGKKAGRSGGPAALAIPELAGPPTAGVPPRGGGGTKADSSSLHPVWAVTPAPSNGMAAALAVVMARAELVRVTQAHAGALVAASTVARDDTSAAATAARAQARAAAQRVTSARRAVEQALTAAGKAPAPPATRPTPRPLGGSATRHVPPANPGPTRGW